jgi:hypothetical protein
MISTKVYFNMDNSKVDSINVEYGFTFMFIYDKKNYEHEVQIVHLILLSPTYLSIGTKNLKTFKISLTSITRHVANLFM